MSPFRLTVFPAAIIVACCVTGLVRDSAGQTIPLADLTIDRLKAYVNDPRNQVTTVEEFMRRLPTELRQTFSLIEDSHSRQRPSDTPYPRLMMFLPDGRLFVTVATNHRSRAYDQVEMLEFTSNMTWRLDLIDFGPSTKDAKKLPRTDALRDFPKAERCSECHGAQSRPIWGNYDEWYGVFADNSSQQLTERQARRLTEALDPRGSNPRIRLLEWKQKFVWSSSETFNLPAYYDSASPDLPNDAILSRHSEHLWSRMSQVADHQKLSLAYLFLQRGDFLEGNSVMRRAEVRAAKEKMRRWIDAEFARQPRAFQGTIHSDRALILWGLDVYDDLFVRRALADLNADFESKENFVDRNFGAGGDDLQAFLNLLIVNDLVRRYPRLADHFRSVPYSQGGFGTLDDYRTGLTHWLWAATLSDRLSQLSMGRHKAGLLRTTYLLPEEWQKLAVDELLTAASVLFP